MNNALSSFALIKSCLRQGNDSIDAFIPLVTYLMFKKDYSSVEIQTICEDFANEFDINIPRYPMETILNRMKPHYLSRNKGRILVNKKEVEKKSKNIPLSEERSNFRKLLLNFIDFCKNFQTPIIIELEEADDLFTDFLMQHDLDILFATESNSLTSIITGTSEILSSDKKFLVNRYVNEIMRKGGDFSDYLNNSAIGHYYASTILYREFLNIRGKGICSNCYLDIGILFDLLGFNDEFRKQTTSSFLSMLKDKGSILKVFRHNYTEFVKIIEGCLNWIDSSDYKSEKASRALLFFIDKGYDKNDIQLFISRVPEKLKQHNIEIVEKPNPNIDQYYEIDRDQLKQLIVDIYNSDGHFFDLEEKMKTIELDIDSIESIYKLRKSNVPINLNETNHVLISTNTGLAYAAAKFEKTVIGRDYFTIPAVLTDVFLGTIIWVSEPSCLIEHFSRSKMIAYTNAAIQPKSNLMARFSIEVEKARKDTENPITDESASLLLQSNLARVLLADSTLSDLERITYNTPYEIQQEIIQSISAKAEKETNQAVEKFLTEKLERETVEEHLLNQIITTEVWINKTAKKRKWMITIPVILLSVTITFLFMFDIIPPIINKLLNILVTALGGSITTFVTLSKKIEDNFKKNLKKQLLPADIQKSITDRNLNNANQ